MSKHIYTGKSNIEWYQPSIKMAELYFTIWDSETGEMGTLCCLYLFLTATKDAPRLFSCKSWIRRTHSFRSEGLYLVNSCNSKSYMMHNQITLHTNIKIIYTSVITANQCCILTQGCIWGLIVNFARKTTAAATIEGKNFTQP